MAIDSTGRVVQHAVISSVITAFLGTFLNAITSVSMRPISQKLESSGLFNLDAKDVIGQYGEDLVEKAKRGELDIVTGREDKQDELFSALSKGENPCIIGEPGVGKTAFVEGAADMIAKGEVPEEFKLCRIIKIDFPSLIMGKGYGGDSNGGLIRLRALFEYARKHPEIIIFIDEIHQFSQFADLCKTYLDRGQIKLIGATTMKEFDLYFGKDEALKRRFRTIVLDEPSLEESFKILKARVPKLEERFHVKISDHILITTVNLGERHAPFKRKPDRDVKLLLAAAELASRSAEHKEVIVHTKPTFIDVLAKRKSTHIVTEIIPVEVNERHVRQAVSSLVNIPVNAPTPMEQLRLTTMNMRIKYILRGQDEAVDMVCESVKKARIELNNPEHVRGAFLLAGPSGVGKTYLTEIIGSEVGDRVLIDAAQYDNKMRAALINKVNNCPYTVIVFDGLEKAKPATLGEISSILDSGMLIDQNGIKVNFRSTFIMLTSNTGPNEMSRQEIIDSLINSLGSGVVNKVDEIIIFNRLSEDILTELSKMMVENIKAVVSSRFNIDLEYDDSIIPRIVAEGIDPLQGARGIEKCCNKFILDFITRNLMDGSLIPGNKIVLSLLDDKINCDIIQKEPEPEEKNNPEEENISDENQMEENPEEENISGEGQEEGDKKIEENTPEENQNEVDCTAV